MANVTVYTTPTCVWCGKAKDFLKDNKIPFKEVDVAANQEAAEFMIEKSGQMGVPVIQIGDEFIVGYDRNAMKKALKLEAK